jgi:hypothetical protein
MSAVCVFVAIKASMYRIYVVTNPAAVGENFR